jgi:iron complex transport system ATP-binding protein
MAGKEIQLSLERLDVGFPDRLLLSSIRASACSGELVAVIGHNGVGKSTLLRTIAGIRTRLGGEIRIDGKETSEMGRKEFASLVGYVSTEQVNTPNMKVFDLVALGRFSYTNWMGSLTDEDRSIVLHSIEKVGMSHLVRRDIDQLSDGEKQRAMIARVLAQDTRLLVMDEPTAFLDIKNRFEVLHLLKSLASTFGKTVIMSTHDLQSALGESDKIWLLTNGELKEGAPEDMVLNGSFDNLFGEAQIKFRKSDGLFHHSREERGAACIKGDGLNRLWTARAIKRLGFRIKESVAADEMTVFAGEQNNEWIVTVAGKKMIFTTIYDMAEWIKREV